MRHAKLIAWRDEMTGTLGLVVEGMPRTDETNSAVDGAGIAHDLIEHVNGVGEIGDIADELEALGACWFVRGRHGDLRREGRGSLYSPEESLAADVARMAVDVALHGAPLLRLGRRTRRHSEDPAFLEIIRVASTKALAELEGEDFDGERFNLYFTEALARLRVGYRKAARKYGPGYAANSMFWNIADAVDPHARNVEYEGAEFLLSYDEHGARCKEYYA